MVSSVLSCSSLFWIATKCHYKQRKTKGKVQGLWCSITLNCDILLPNFVLGKSSWVLGSINDNNSIKTQFNPWHCLLFWTLQYMLIANQTIPYAWMWSCVDCMIKLSFRVWNILNTIVERNVAFDAVSEMCILSPSIKAFRLPSFLPELSS